MRERISALRPFFREDYGSFLFTTAVSFGILLVLSFVVGLISPNLAASVVNWFTGMVQDSGIVSSDGAIHIAALLISNLQALFFAIFYGFIPYIYFPALSVGTNSMLLGLFAAVYVNEGRSLLYYLMGILPHGIFEIPAMILAMACGLYLCSVITRYVRGEKGIVAPALHNIVTLYVVIILPLIVAAAFTECYLTPVILQAIS